MKTIVITGSSGSGKTRLSNRLADSLTNAIILRTDSYYRDDLFIKLLSIFLIDIYDRLFSIKYKELKSTISSISNKNNISIFYDYDFKRKKSARSIRKVDPANSINYLILEGIFAHRLDLNYKETINVLCKEKKEICYERRLKRDQTERKRNIDEVIKKFNYSWNLFFINLESYLHQYDVMTLNPSNQKSYNNLISKLEKKN